MSKQVMKFVCGLALFGSEGAQGLRLQTNSASVDCTKIEKSIKEYLTKLGNPTEISQKQLENFFKESDYIIKDAFSRISFGEITTILGNNNVKIAVGKDKVAETLTNEGFKTLADQVLGEGTAFLELSKSDGFSAVKTFVDEYVKKVADPMAITEDEISTFLKAVTKDDGLKKKFNELSCDEINAIFVPEQMQFQVTPAKLVELLSKGDFGEFLKKVKQQVEKDFAQQE